jgi:hypothetical protein
MQVLLVDPAEGAQVGPQCCARPFTGVAVHFTSAIAIIIPRSLMDAMADCRMGWMTPSVTLPLISINSSINSAIRNSIMRPSYHS